PSARAARVGGAVALRDPRDARDPPLRAARGDRPELRHDLVGVGPPRRDLSRGSARGPDAPTRGPRGIPRAALPDAAVDAGAAVLRGADQRRRAGASAGADVDYPPTFLDAER